MKILTSVAVALAALPNTRVVLGQPFLLEWLKTVNAFWPKGS